MFRIKLKELREQHNLSQYDLADKLGIKQSTIAMWENGTNNPRHTTLLKISEFFNVPIDFLTGNSASKQKNASISVPVLGYVAAGIPIEAIEEILDYEELDVKQFNPYESYFGLKIKGDSMMPRIQDGDTVIVRCQPDVESGEIAVVCVNGSDATCKQIKKHDNGISLIPLNPSHEIKFYTKEEIETLPITIMGKVVELRGKF